MALPAFLEDVISNHYPDILFNLHETSHKAIHEAIARSEIAIRRAAVDGQWRRAVPVLPTRTNATDASQ
jgi:hypothetical protein